MILTYKYRIKDRRASKALRAHASAVNVVWNYCVSTQRKIEDRVRAGGLVEKWPTQFDWQKLTAGTSRELGINAHSVAEVCRVYTQSRNAISRNPRFRASGGSRRALGWVPFRVLSRQIQGNAIVYCGRTYRVWLGGRSIPESAQGGCFVEDVRGRWYICLQVEVAESAASSRGRVGIDLGLKSLAACSDGHVVEALRSFRQNEHRLGVAQRAGNRRRARAIYAKIANARRDFLHKASTKIARQNSLIVVGNVNATKLKRTKMAKSVSDAGWSMFRNMLRYKASRHGGCYVEVDERFTSQTCSRCGVIPASSPKGMGALGIRRWECSDCGAVHERDVNAAINILNVALSAQRHADGSRRRSG